MGGAHQNSSQTATALKKSLLKHLQALKKIPLEKLLPQRYAKFRQIGEFADDIGSNGA